MTQRLKIFMATWVTYDDVIKNDIKSKANFENTRFVMASST